MNGGRERMNKNDVLFAWFVTRDVVMNVDKHLASGA